MIVPFALFVSVARFLRQQINEISWLNYDICLAIVKEIDKTKGSDTKTHIKHNHEI